MTTGREGTVERPTPWYRDGVEDEANVLGTPNRQIFIWDREGWKNEVGKFETNKIILFTCNWIKWANIKLASLYLKLDSLFSHIVDFLQTIFKITERWYQHNIYLFSEYFVTEDPSSIIGSCIRYIWYCIVNTQFIVNTDIK